MQNTNKNPFAWLGLLGLLLAVCSTQSHANGPITFQPLVGSNVQEIPVCFDESTGELGQCSTAPKTSYARSVLVSQAGTGDYTSPIDAMAELDAWCTNTGAPATVNRCEIRIAPGIYFLGDQTLQMVDFVDVRGSGPTTTVLISDVEFDTSLDPRGVINSAEASLEDLTVINTADNANPDFAKIVVLVNTQGFRMDRVFAYTNAAASAGGIGAVVVLDGGFVRIFNSFLYATSTVGGDNFGLLVEESAANVSSSTIWARNGANNESVAVVSEGLPSTVDIFRSFTDEVFVRGNPAAALNFHWSRVKTAVSVTDGATADCLYSFEEVSLTPLNSDCSQ